MTSFFDHLKAAISKSYGPAEHRQSQFSDISLAVAALLVEAATQDNQFDPAERASVLAILERRFDLDNDQAAELLELAEDTCRDANQILSFTRTVKDHFSAEGRIELMEMLWEIVLADGNIDDYESNLLRRVAGLIYVTDRESGEARQTVLARLGQG